MKYYSPYFRKKHVTKSLGKLFLFIRQISCDLYFSYSPHPRCKFIIRLHPFMTSTRRRSYSGGRMWTGEGGQAQCGRSHRKLKLESTDVILSSSRAKKLVYFLPEFLLWTE